MEGYQFTSSLQAPGSAPAGNTSLQFQQQPTNLISQEQYYYEYQQPQHQQQNCTDYLFAPPSLSQNSPLITYTYTNTQAIYNSTDFSNSFTAAVSNNINNVTYVQQPAFHSTIVPESFDFGVSNDFNTLFQDSSVFLSPQASSAASSASQSPEQSKFFTSNDAAAADSLDLSLDELLQNIGSEESNIFGNGVEVNDLALSDELLEVLAKDVGEDGEDFFSELNFPADENLLSPAGLEISSNTSVCSSDFLNSSSSNSSVSSTPKRKYSSDSSSSNYSNYSEASYQTFNSNSSEPEDVPKVEISSKLKPNNGNKRARRTPKASPVEKAARKKDQNKRAACRYRSKKRVELQSSEMTMEELEAVRDRLSEQVKKLQTEFSVILPLARAAFAFDAGKREHLQSLLGRVEGMLS